MSEPKYKPCPFCGEQPDLSQVYADSMVPKDWLLRCEKCKIQMFAKGSRYLGVTGGGTVDIEVEAKERLAARWNKRAKEQTNDNN